MSVVGWEAFLVQDVGGVLKRLQVDSAMPPALFHTTTPTLDNYWRAIILFGLNVASYKFALAQALTELAAGPKELVRLEDLAEPFSRHICEHLKTADKQTTSRSSKFLDSCRSFNAGSLTKAQLIETTVRFGFNNVIDAFHIVNHDEVGVRFFVDERKTAKGIRITDDMYRLLALPRHANLQHETEARWRLVETAWDLGLSRNLVLIEHDAQAGELVTQKELRRTSVTSSRSALNGYQKGKCFYCFAPISIVPGDDELADVDHFFPHTLKGSGVVPAIDGVWNLVLACHDCNKGTGGKFAKVPSIPLLERLSKRNEYLIESHHPLRETLIAQTGKDARERVSFLQYAHSSAKRILIHEWQPEPRGSSLF